MAHRSHTHDTDLVTVVELDPIIVETPGGHPRQALALKQPDLNWRLVAKTLGTPDTKLRRLAPRLTGDNTLVSLNASGTACVFERFTASLADPFRSKLP